MEVVHILAVYMCPLQACWAESPAMSPETVAGGAAAPHGVHPKSDDSITAGASDAPGKTHGNTTNARRTANPASLPM